VRAARRHHRRRMISKVRWYHGGDRVYADAGHAIVTENSTDICARISAARQSCSRPMCCGNPRRIRGRKYITRQEILAGVTGSYRG